MPTCSMPTSFTTWSMWSTMCSIVVGSRSRTKLRTPVMPMTPPLRGELRDRLVGLEPRVVVERAAVRVRDRDRLLRDLDRVERRPVAAVRDVHQHAGLVHRRDDLGAEVADAAVHAVGAAGAEQVLAVVGELRAALAELVEGLDVLGAPGSARSSACPSSPRTCRRPWRGRGRRPCPRRRRGRRSARRIPARRRGRRASPRPRPARRCRWNCGSR